MKTATAVAHPNIALIKYWGKRDIERNLPAVSSLSLTLDHFETRTTVQWGTKEDRLFLNGDEAGGLERDKVFRVLNRLQADRPPARVVSQNNFPTGAGLASSSSAFAALVVAADAAAETGLDRPSMSALSRRGSGSACRSLYGGWVMWRRGRKKDGRDSHGVPVADRQHWAVSMVVGIVDPRKKKVGSTEGMERSRTTSAYYDSWVNRAETDVQEARSAVLARDLERLGTLMEQSTMKMHATMISSWPPLLYWQPGTVGCLHAIYDLRASGVGAWATMDAGPQVKVLCERPDAQKVATALAPHCREVLVLGPGHAPKLV